jgi:succinyl-diaminopimelate desuccinylase
MDSPAKPTAVGAAQDWLEQHEQELIEDTRSLLRIESLEAPAEPNAPFGSGCRRALDFVLNLGVSWGMRTRDVEGFAGHAEFGSGDGLVMSLGHVDVVPVSDGWKHAPFGAEIDDGYLFARGALDDKGPTMAAFYAARALKETGADLGVRMRLVFGCNEESGFRCVKRYFEVEEAPTFGVAPDAGWPLYHAEKGIADFVIRAPRPVGGITLVSMEGGQRPNIVVDHVVAIAEIAPNLIETAKETISEYWDKNITFAVDGTRCTIESRGKAAHGSEPFQGDSAVVRAFRAIRAIAPADQFDDYSSLLELGQPSGVGLGILGCDDVSGGLTTNIGIVHTDGADLVFTVNVRYPVKWTGRELQDKWENHRAKDLPTYKLDRFSDSPPLYFPLDQKPVTTIVDVYRQETGDDKAPGVMGGGTYARAVPNTVSIGTGWEGDGPAHENDEKVRVDHLLKMAKIYAHIFYRLAQDARK